jgi:hypothetical protein
LGRIVGVLTIAVGLLLLGLAVPRSMANILLLPGNSALDQLRAGETITADGYNRILSSRDAALQWVELPQARLDLGLTLYLMSQEARRLRVESRRALLEARRQLKLGLVASPAQVQAWLWLADIEQVLGNLDEAAQAVRLSLLSAPHDVNFPASRARMALLLWERLSDDAKRIAARDTATAVAAPGGQEFVAGIIEQGSTDALRDAVASDPMAAARLTELLSQQKTR